MTNPGIASGSDGTKSQNPPLVSFEERLQKLVDRALFSGGSIHAQKIRNFLNGTWIGEPLHIILTDVPIGAWTAALVFDGLELISGRREFAIAADTSIAIGLAGGVCAAVTGVTDWSDVDPPARRIGMIHGLLNLSATSLFASSLIVRKKKSRGMGRVFAALGFGVMTVAAHLGGKMVYQHGVGVDRTTGEALPLEFIPVLPESELAEEDNPHVPNTMACQFCWFEREPEFSRWRRPARISVGLFRKVSWMVTALSAPGTPPGSHWGMAGCSTARPYTRSPAWRPASAMGRLKCASQIGLSSEQWRLNEQFEPWLATYLDGSITKTFVDTWNRQ